MIELPQNDFLFLKTLLEIPQEQTAGKLTEYIAETGANANTLGSMRQFVLERMQTATEKYKPIMQNIIGCLEKEINKSRDSMSNIEAMSAELFELETQRDEIEKRIEALKAGLKPLLVHKITDTMNFSIKFSAGYPYLKIIDKKILPPEFFTLQPDRTKLHARFKESGEVLPGTELVMRKDTIIVYKKKVGGTL
jgi:hypothetical protein